MNSPFRNINIVLDGCFLNVFLFGKIGLHHFRNGNINNRVYV